MRKPFKRLPRPVGLGGGSVARSARRALAKVERAARLHVLKRHASWISDDRVMRCRPAPGEADQPMSRKDRRRLAGNNGKIVFPNQAAAEATAVELMQIGGCKALSPYACPRGGHFHLHGELPAMDGDVA